MKPITHIGQQFVDNLAAANTHALVLRSEEEQSEKVHVVSAGGSLTAAYEQLRNAAEYAEEHLLLQRAIRRFYRRFFLPRDRRAAANSAEELIVELTLAGYLPNDSLPVNLVEKINHLAVTYYDARMSFGLAKPHTDAWTLDVLAVEIESLINDSTKHDVFIQFCHNHFLETLSEQPNVGTEQPDFSIALFVAVHRALLRSDEASIRRSLLHRYGQIPDNAESYKATNQKLDELFASDLVETLFRIVRRQGAPFRVLWRMVSEHENLDKIIVKRDEFLSAYEQQVMSEYESLSTRINKGIIKSVIFLVITKFLIGVSIEVPYDLWMSHTIIWLPLVINLLFPPIYMVLLRFTLMLPGEANTRAMVEAADRLFYGDEAGVSLSRRSKNSFGAAYNAVYVFFFIVVFGGVSYDCTRQMFMHYG